MTAERAALKLGDATVTGPLDNATVPVAGHTDAVSPSELVVGDRRERPRFTWCRAGDRLGRPDQAFERDAKLAWEPVRPLDEEGAGRRVNGN
jgi:hypothetical protein